MFTLLADIVAMVANALQIDVPNAQHGVAIGGSYNAAESTVQAQHGDTGAITSDSGDMPVWRPDIPLLTIHVGDQYGPVGNERVAMLESTHGPVAAFIHGPDDSPQAPSGERWIAHRNAAGEIDSFTKLTNDGPTQGDGLGGVLQNGGALHKLTTSAGFTIEQNDTAKTTTVTSPGGHSVTIDDNAATKGVTVQTAGGLVGHFDDVAQQIKHAASATVYTLVNGNGDAIAQVAGKVALGDLFGNLSAAEAAINQTHLSQFKDDVRKMVGNALQQVIQNAIAASVTNAAPWLASVQAGLKLPSLVDLTGSIVDADVPSGSSVVRLVT